MRAWALALLLLAPGLSAAEAAPAESYAGWRPLQLRLTLHPDELAKLESRRALALWDRHLHSASNFWVEGRLDADGTTMPVRLRLKGNTAGHWSHAKRWSFRVQTRQGGRVLGMGTFSLHRLGLRGALWEWLGAALLRQQGLLAGRYELLRLSLNGEDLGVYALEDHDKDMPESLGRRPGPVLSFDDERFWSTRVNQLRRAEAARFDKADQYYEAPIQVLGSKALTEDPAQAALAEHAKKLLDLYRRQRLGASQVFDIPQLARFMAALELLGSPHPLYPHNVKLYYDPLAGRFEPVGQDFTAGDLLRISYGGLHRKTARLIWDVSLEAYVGPLIRDPELRAAFLAERQRLAQPAALDALRRSLEPAVEARARFAQTQAMQEPQLLWGTLYRNQLRMRDAFRGVPSPPGDGPQRLRAAILEADGDRVKLQVQNVSRQGFKVVAGEAGSPMDPPLRLEGSLHLPPAAPGTPPPVRELVLRLPAGQRWDPAWRWRTVVLGHIPGERDGFFEEAFFAQPWDEAFLAADPLLSPLAMDPEAPPPAGWTRDSDGAWRLPADGLLERSVVVPRGLTLRAGAGSTLRLGPGASLICQGPLELLGEAGRPVLIRSEKGGGGLAVLNSPGLSVLRHARFVGLAAPTLPGRAFTGGLTFSQSPLQARHCSFEAGPSEDALNVVRGRVEMEDCRFSDSAADAFDLDYAEGWLRRCSFNGSGNDAVDASGGELSYEDLEIRGVGDKGLSVGENARVRARGIRIRDGEIGIASKDGGQLAVEGLVMKDLKLGFAVFQKKKIYGPASAEADKAELSGIGTAHLVESGSSLKLNGRALASDQAAVRARLYGEDFGKASRR